MKFLCVCHRGNSRSVALGWILKDVLGQDAIAMGIEAAGEDTRQMLFDWAEYIIVVDQAILPHIPAPYHAKTHLWHVGGDRFFRAFSPELLNIYAGFIADSGLASPRLHFTEEKPGVIQVGTITPPVEVTANA